MNEIRLKMTGRIVMFGLFAALGTACGGDQPGLAEDEQGVIGGAGTDIANYPWQVSLRGSRGHSCGGAIIDDRWVLTAAHCVVGASASNFRVAAGFAYQSNLQSAQTISVEEIYVHPEYGSANEGRDAALLKLRQDFNVSGSLVKVIQRVTTQDEQAGLIAPGVQAIVSGWGTSGNGGSPDRLQHLSMPIISRAEADLAYGAGAIGADMLPVSTSANGSNQTPCYGDSGGPLVVADGAGGFKHAGVVSWGNACQGPDPAIYSNTAYFNTWIDNIMNPPPPVALDNGVAVSGVSSSAGAWSHFVIELPPNAGHFNVSLNGGSGDADLYVRHLETPTRTDNDCASEGSTTQETCTISAPQPGSYFISIFAWSAFSGSTLSASFSAP